MVAHFHLGVVFEGMRAGPSPICWDWIFNLLYPTSPHPRAPHPWRFTIQSLFHSDSAGVALISFGLAAHLLGAGMYSRPSTVSYTPTMMWCFGTYVAARFIADKGHIVAHKLLKLRCMAFNHLGPRSWLISLGQWLHHPSLPPTIQH